MYNKSMQKLSDMKIFNVNVGNSTDVDSIMQSFKDKMKRDNIDISDILLVPTRDLPTGWAPVQMETLTKI